MGVEGKGSAGDSASGMELLSSGFSGGGGLASGDSSKMTGGESSPTAGTRSNMASLLSGLFTILSALSTCDFFWIDSTFSSTSVPE